MLYAAMNAPRSPQKATNWSDIKNDKWSKEIRLSRYQSLDKKHVYVYVKFKSWVVHFVYKKMSFKKVRLFQVCPFFKWRALKFI
jgi:hypothetical protein